MESVAFYSYKGGVGRSLLLVNTARFLALTGRKVVALDLDFEAPGLHYKLKVEKKVEMGAVRLLQRSLDGDLPTLDEVREATVEVPMPATHGGWLRLVAAGPAPTAEYWAYLSRLHELLVANQDAGLLEAVLDLQARIEEAWSPDVLLVDARTGVTGLGGIATMALCDRVVLMTTRAKESLDGILAVAESLRATPTLRGGKRRLEFVVSRVQGTESVERRELLERLGEHSELPNDRYDGGAERLLGDGLPPIVTLDSDRNVASSLLVRTLAWISRQFPTEADLAKHARDRLVAVEQVWRELTAPSERVGKWFHRRSCWPADMLATNVEFSGSDGSTRVADIVARLESGEIVMIIEYIDGEPDATVVQWWTMHATARAVVLLWEEDLYQNNQWQPRRMFLGKEITRGPEFEDTRRWYLPKPREFEILRDPTDLSVDAMLEAAKHTDFHDERLVAAWVRAQSTRGPQHTFRHRLARKILDGLATIDPIERAKAILWTSKRTSSYRDMWTHSGDDYLDQLVLDGLCAPLCWRLPPQAFVDISEDQRFDAPPAAFYAVRRLASFMGLEYDPDAVFRRQASLLVDDDDGDIHALATTLQARTFQFEWASERLPLPGARLPPARELPSRPLGYHGHLGTYTPATGRIVLAAPTIDSVAQSLGRAPRHIGSVTLLHLSVLGLLHNGIDLDGQRWEGFSTGDPSPWTGGVPPVTIVLAQFFVHRFLVELDDHRLLDAFAALTDVQPPEHGVWRAMPHVSLEAGRAWMISLRRGTGGRAPIDLEALLRPR